MKTKYVQFDIEHSRSTSWWLNGWGYYFSVKAHTFAHVVLRSPFTCLLQTTASPIQKWYVGRITALLF